MNSGGVRRSSIVAMGDPTLASTVPYAPSCMTMVGDIDIGAADDDDDSDDEHARG